MGSCSTQPTLLLKIQPIGSVFPAESNYNRKRVRRRGFRDALE